MRTNILTLAITLTIGVILAGSLLMPVISDATTTHVTFENAGYFDMKYTETESVSLSWDHTDPHNITINGEVVALEESPAAPRTIICGDSWFVRYGGDSLAWYASSGSAAGASVAGETDATLTAANGSVSFTGGTTTRTGTYTYLYVVAEDGEFVMKTANDKAYLNGDSTIYAMGLTSNVLSQDVYVKSVGTPDDGITSTVFRYSGATPITVKSVSDSFVTESAYLDLYSIEKFVITVTNGTNDADLIYSYFIVPAEVTAEKAVHFTDGENAIIAAIPVLIIAGLVIVAAGALYLKRDD